MNNEAVIHLWERHSGLPLTDTYFTTVSASSAGHLFRIVSVDYVVYMYTINNMYVHLNNMYIYCQ